MKYPEASLQATVFKALNKTVTAMKQNFDKHQRTPVAAIGNKTWR
jgi:hypothetical protein